MGKVFCFGELLLRMSPAMDRQWIHDASVPVYLGGAELNVAAALSAWEIPVKYCTVLPDNALGKEIVEELREKKIDTSAVLFSGDKIGIYFLPQGTDLKNTGVIYDRAQSSFAGLQPGMINWDKALEDCDWFHFSAISPALNENTAAVCKEALQAASAKGLTISVDLNYRAKLWQYGKRPAEVMPALVQYCDVVMGNIWSAGQLLGIAAPIPDSIARSGTAMTEAAEQSMQQLQHEFPKAGCISYTFRLEEKYFAILQMNKAITVSKEFPLKNIIDKVGSGDCFMAGLIYGFYNQLLPEAMINFAAAAATGKMQEKGDATRQTIQSIKHILNKA